jgi:TPR repeat protein
MKHRTTPHWQALALGACALGLALAAHAGPAEDFAAAESEFARGDLKAAMTLWRKAAEAGHALSMAHMADILDKSDYDEEAVQWYRKSAEQGEAAGIFGLGQMYAKGEGVPKDGAKAFDYVLQAARKNNVDAAIMLVGVYRNGGLGQPANPAEADAWEARLVQLVPGYQTEAARKAAAAAAPKKKGAK